MENKNETGYPAKIEQTTSEYLGYLIRPSTDPWAIKYNMPFEYFKIEGDGQLHGAGSIEACKDEIDSRLDSFLERLDKTAKAL